MKAHEDLSVIKKVAKLQCMTLKELDEVWRSMFDHALEITSRKYMIGKIAYKIQEQVYGSLDVETENKMKACAKKTESKTKGTTKPRKFCPMIGTKIVKLLVNLVQIQNSGLKMNLNLDGLNRLLIEIA